MGHAEPAGTHLQPEIRANRDAGRGPRVFPGTDHRAGAHRPLHRAPPAVCGCPHAHPGHPAHGHPIVVHQGDRSRASGGPSILKELSNERLAVDMEDATRLNVCATGRAGLHRRRVRDPVDREHDPARGPGKPVRHPGAGRHGGRQGHGPGCTLLPAGLQDVRRAGRPFREDLLHRGWVRYGHRFLPRADRDGRRQEAPRAGRTHHGLQRGRSGCLGRRHGPEHLPVRRPRSP